MFNYATLGNVVNHVHLHLIPRYKEEMIFDGITFKDKNWGRNYASYDTGFTIPEEATLRIRDRLKSLL